MQKTIHLRSLLQSLRERARRNRRGLPIRQYVVRFDELQLVVECDSVAELVGSKTEWVVRWADIRSVVAFKTDDLTSDTIWIRVAEDENESIGIPEEAVGFREVVSIFPVYLSGCLEPEVWLPEVAQSPFSENQMVLFAAAA